MPYTCEHFLHLFLSQFFLPHFDGVEQEVERDDEVKGDGTVVHRVDDRGVVSEQVAAVAVSQGFGFVI